MTISEVLVMEGEGEEKEEDSFQALETPGEPDLEVGLETLNPEEVNEVVTEVLLAEVIDGDPFP